MIKDSSGLNLTEGSGGRLKPFPGGWLSQRHLLGAGGTAFAAAHHVSQLSVAQGGYEHRDLSIGKFKKLEYVVII